MPRQSTHYVARPNPPIFREPTPSTSSAKPWSEVDPHWAVRYRPFTAASAAGDDDKKPKLFLVPLLKKLFSSKSFLICLGISLYIGFKLYYSGNSRNSNKYQEQIILNISRSESIISKLKNFIPSKREFINFIIK